MARLKEIEDAEDLCNDKIFDLIYELDEIVEDDEARIKSLRSMSGELRKRVRTNALEVNVQMAEILTDHEENKPMLAVVKKAKLWNSRKRKREDDMKAVLKEVELKSTPNF